MGKININGYDSIKRVYSIEGLSPALTTMQGGNRQPKILIYLRNEKIRIRKLTPKECLRLMGVKDKEIDKFTISDSQKYKQALK